MGYDDDDQATDTTTNASGITPASPGGKPAKSLDPTMPAFDHPPMVLTWLPGDYAPVVTGSGAEKLADSAVAPLVAAARGYWTVREDNLAKSVAQMGVKLSTKQGKRFAAACRDMDSMVMPAHRFDVVAEAALHGTEPVAVYYQFRPARPETFVTEAGKIKELKYEVISGQELSVGANPGTPASWFTGTTPFLVTEGLLKADSALSALLISCGVSQDELRLQASDVDTTGARARLRALMDAVPADQRVLVLSISSCNTWHNKSEWTGLLMSGREGWIGLDADVATNANVWREAAGMWSYFSDRKAKPRLLSPVVPTGLGATSGDEKYGVDDYLAKIGDWESLKGCLLDALPPAPTVDPQAVPGNWRVDPDGCSVSECVAVKDVMGNATGAIKWEPRVQIGARIAARLMQRVPTDQEIATGFLDPTAPVDEPRVVIEVAYRDEDGVKQTFEVVGPDKLLNGPISKWAETPKSTVPYEVIGHPEWPIVEHGSKWLRAVKQSSFANAARRFEWTRMGWVPVEGSPFPAFIVGSDVICDPGDEDKVTRGVVPEERGVTGTVLHGSDTCGLDDMDPRPFDDPEYLASVKDDLTRLFQVFVTAQPFTDTGMTLLVLGAALRYAIPVRNQLSVYLEGTANSGKSWTAKVIMSFWRARTSRQSFNHLSGSAQDTLYATERAMSMTPLWVYDDLAPTASLSKSRDDQDRVELLIRTKFNMTPKRRGSMVGTERAQFQSEAVLVVTAENEIGNRSVAQRAVTYSFRPRQGDTPGSLHISSTVTDAVEELCREGVPARITQALVKLIRYKAHASSWAEVVEYFQAQRSNLEVDAIAHLRQQRRSDSDSAKRASELASDVLLPLVELIQLAVHVGVDIEHLDILNPTHSMPKLVELLGKNMASHAQTKPGRGFLNGIRALLTSGQAHIGSFDFPGEPPTDEHDTDGHFVAHTLGWRPQGQGDRREWRPVGSSPEIGKFTVHGDGQRMVIIDKDAAYRLVATRYPDLMPAGSKEATVSRALWNEQLTVPEGVETGIKRRGESRTIQWSKTMGGSRRWVSGIPLPFEHFSGATDSAENTDADNDEGES